MSYFDAIAPVRFEGTESEQALAFRHYQADRVILGRSMAEHLRFSACYWHNFVWPGFDMFGLPVFERPWFAAGSPMDQALARADAAFDFFTRLGVPFYTFHDTDVAPPSDRIGDYVNDFARMVDVLERKQAETGMRLLWGTANLFSHPRYAAGAATSPQPEVFAFAATQVCHAMAATHRLGGENYVLWGGREGYDTLLNTDLKRERLQAGRFLAMAVEHKHKLGFQGDILIEPKPQEPTKHQYDYDVATVYGFLKDFGLEGEVKVNIEANHATLAGHSFHHEVATAISLGIFGSVDANRGDPQNGWDTDQFPNSVEECTLVMYEILKAGGFRRGGFNFDTKVRRQSSSPADLFHGHVGAMDVLALALERAARMIENDLLEQVRAQRYAGWDSDYGRGLLDASASLQGICDTAVRADVAPRHVSGEQERLENLVNRFIFG